MCCFCEGVPLSTPSMYQAQFVQTLKKNFAAKRKWHTEDIRAFQQRAPAWYGQIHVDVNRSLFQFANAFRANGIEVRQAQAIFERYFVDVYNNQSPERRENYFQGLTDVFELIFFAHVDLVSISKHQRELSVVGDKFETYLGDIHKFFALPYWKVLSIGINVMDYVWKQTSFNLHKLLSQSNDVIRAIRKHDPALGQFLRVIPDKQQEVSMLKYTISCCLHFSLIPEIGFLVGDFYLNSSIDEQVFFIQHAISLGARQLVAGLPSLGIVSNELYQIMPGKLSREHVEEEHGFFVLQESVPMMYRLEPSAAGKFVSEVHAKYEEMIRARNQNIAISTSVAVVTVAGIVGGILGAVLK